MKLAWLALLFLSGCQPSLNRQPKDTALAESAFFADGAAARPLPHGVVPFRAEKEPPPAPFRSELLRGRGRYEIYCAACHGLSGEGGVAGARGFTGIPSLLAPHALALSDEENAAVIRDGQGRMASLGGRLPERDIQAITAYLRALQLSQHARLRDLPARDQAYFAGGER
jgi:mono/diheme cytochrome c family protein